MQSSLIATKGHTNGPNPPQGLAGSRILHKNSTDPQAKTSFL